jgi:hypothetical protein
VLAESGFASFDNFEELERRNKIIYIPDQQMNTEAEKELNPYHRNHFVYDEKKIVSYARKIKNCLFIITIFIKEQNSKAMCTSAKIARCVRNIHFAPKGNTDRYMLQKGKPCDTK